MVPGGPGTPSEPGIPGRPGGPWRAKGREKFTEYFLVLYVFSIRMSLYSRETTNHQGELMK